VSEDIEYRIPARIDDLPEIDDTFQKQDPFNKAWDELKSLEGLENNFKRRATRMSKVDAPQSYIDSARAESTGIGGAKSKEINPGLIYRNGYGLCLLYTSDAADEC
jgi:hypothetical protein